MNKEEIRDYIFYINWEDFQKNKNRVGFLANINQQYYIIMSDDQHAPFAYQRGFNGLPGFIPQTIYKSDEIFDFFKQRISDKALKENPCEELVQSHGISMIDSFSLEEVDSILYDRYKESILQAYKIQKEQEEIKENEENKKIVKTDSKSKGKEEQPMLGFAE